MIEGAVDKFTRLSDTIFKGRATDDLAAVDARTVVDEGKVISAFKNKGMMNSPLIDKLATDFKGLKLGDVTKYIDKGTLLVDKKRLMEDVLNGMGKYGALIMGDQPGGILDKLKDRGLDLAGWLDGDVIHNAQLLIEEAKYVFDGDNFKDAQSFANYMGRFLGNENLAKFVNLSEESAFLGSLLSYAIDIGLPELIDGIIAESSGDKEVKEDLWGRVGAEAIFSSDLKTLNKALDNTSLSEIRKYAGNPVKSLLLSYASRTNEYDFNRTAEATMLNSTLLRLDPVWNKITLGGKVRVNLSAYQMLSPDARDTLSMLVDHRAYATCGYKIGMKSTGEIMKALYPDLLLLEE